MKSLQKIIEKLYSTHIDAYRAIPFWSWNDKLEIEELLWQIKWMKKQGFGGYFMHARGGLITDYLGEEWFKCIEKCVELGDELGMESWAYDENGWPSGFVGGKLTESSENCDKYLTYNLGKYDEDALVSYEITDSEIVRVKNGGTGEFLNVYEHTSISTADILNPDVVDKFIDETHEKYKGKLGEKFGNSLKGFFTDEPQYHRAHQPYTIMIEKYFKEKYDEDILDKVGLLFVEKKGYKEFRYRFWKGMQELMLKNFAEKIYDWCNENGCSITGHYIEESSLNYQMMCCAGIMPYYEYMTIPGIDTLGSDIVPALESRQVVSVAQQLGKKRVLIETYAGAGWGITPRELKVSAESAYVNGVNLLCQHLLPYSIHGQRKMDFPAHYSWANPWCRKSYREFNDYFAKLGYILGESEENVNVGVFCPIRSSYFEYKRENLYFSDELSSSYKTLTEKLASMNVPYHIIDETILGKYGKVCGNELCVGKCKYKYIIFPKTVTMDKTTKEYLEEYYNNGGKIIFEEEKPSYMEGERCEYSFDTNSSYEEIISSQLYRISDCSTGIRSTLREIDGKKFIFAVNTIDEPVKISFLGNFNSFVYLDLENGKTQKVSTELEFDGYQSRILFLSNDEVDNLRENKDEIILDGEFFVAQCSDNYLVIDNVSYSFDGINYSKVLNCMGVFDQLLAMKKASEVYLKYTFNIDAIPEKIFFLAEKMNSFWCEINGKRVSSCGQSDFEKKVYKYDISKDVILGENNFIIKINFFQKEDVYKVLYGENVTEGLKNKLTYDTTIEPCFVAGDFGVYSRSGIKQDGNQANYVRGKDFYIGKKKHIISNLITDGYPFFSGDIILEKSFTSNTNKAILKLEGNYCLSEITLNDKKIQKSYFAKVIDISDALVVGENRIQIHLWSGNRNLFGPFHFHIEPPGIGPNHYEFRGQWVDGVNSDLNEDYSLRKFGIFNER